MKLALEIVLVMHEAVLIRREVPKQLLTKNVMVHPRSLLLVLDFLFHSRLDSVQPKQLSLGLDISKISRHSLSCQYQRIHRSHIL